MTAVGPYAGTEVVDFTAALDAGIFGIYGETGAGKTTIFDGISFALFGQSSGAERTAEDMVCHHAHATDLTQIELVFDLGSERYVVRRIPSQQRTARKGTGTANQAHEAYLFHATGMSLDDIADGNLGDILAEKRVNVVDPKIEELLGYNAAQFRQIVLLPQGDFRKILTATNDERSPILKRLFDVRLYESFADRIKRDAAALHHQISDERVRRDTHLGGQSEDELAETIRSMTEGITALEVTLKAEGESLAQHQKALTAGESLAEKFEALTAARQAETALTSESESIKVLRTRLTKARAAQTVLVSESALRSANQDAGAAKKRDAEAKENLAKAKSAFAQAKETLDQTSQQTGEREAARAKVLELERFKTTLEQSRALLKDLNSARTSTQSAVTSESEANRKNSLAVQGLSALRDVQKQHPIHARSLQEATAKLTGLEREAEALDRYEKVETKRNLQSNEVVRLKTEHEARRAHLDACKVAFERAEQDLADVQALHVARKLTLGEPCPACGSLDHPDPATGDPERLGRHDQFEQANSDLRAAERLEIEAKSALAAAQSTLMERQKELDALERPLRDRQVLIPVLTQAREKKAALEADERFADLDEKITAAEAAAREASSAFEKARQALSDCKSKETQAQTAYNTLLRDVPEDWRHGDALTAVLSSAINARDQLAAAREAAVNDEKAAAVAVGATEEGIAGAASSVDRTTQAVMTARDEFVKQLSSAGLDETAFQSARADVAQSSSLEEQISTFDQRVAANKAQLERLAKDIGDRNAPDISALTTARDTARDKMGKSQESLTRLKSEVEGKQDVQRKVQVLTTRITALETEYGPLGGIADLVNGTNDRKVRLPDFAIAAMFDEVLVAANQRLGPMTAGRYQLLRPEGTVGGRQKRGLDIAVFDANTEKPRPTKTLSGGEGFQASLALALGLSDVVQQNSGGIKLDAIFIDEGFGTLDEDTLNTALETLYDLTNDMRSVGLISHTEQVKSVITEGFDIEVTPSGSHIHARHTVV
jgi:exonuclease SbcC